MPGPPAPSMCTVFAAYYASDGFEWQQQGDELNRVDIHADSPTISCHAESSGELLFQCALYSDCVYEKPSEQFHQWTAEDGEAYGLSFASVEEADAFARQVEDTIAELAEGAYSRPAPARTTEFTRESSPEAEGAVSMQVGAQDVPPPRKFPLSRRNVAASEASWQSLETMLRLTYPSRKRASVQITGLTELAREEDVYEFQKLYKDFGVTDLWLNVDNEATVEIVSREGFASLGAEQLAFGIPLGMYLLDHDDICGQGKQMIQCKVALGRSLPMSKVSLNSLQEAPLPYGYHSFCIPPPEDAERSLSTFGSIPLGVFEHSFLVPNTSFVLMTNVVSFDVAYEGDPLPEEPAMSLFQSHPEALGLQYKESVLQVCDPAFRDQDDIASAVDQSYEKMWDELNMLADSQGEIQENMRRFLESVDVFKESATERSQQFKMDVVNYQSHTMEVGQAMKDFRFEVNRTLSDINRLQELYMYMRDSSSSGQLIAKWKHLYALCESLKEEVQQQVQTSKPVHPHVMALTEKNKRVVGLRREAMLRDELINRLAGLLDAKGALTPEDEELIALI